ncbi:MAG: transglutaminase domain-containing protein [Bacteroidaceae bacterium]|nr:transglutaminase domain-containing protein [Bacteroidaceae bacterium]
MKQLLCAFAALTLLASCHKDASTAYSWEKDLHHRLLCDFKRTQDEVKEYIQKYIPDVTDEQMAQWDATGALEWMELDGQKLYFKNAAPNLFRIDSACIAIKQKEEGTALSKYQKVDSVNVPQVMQEAGKHPQHLAAPKHMRITYTLTVDADAVPAGETLRCWLPYPRSDHQRQTDVKFISASEPQYTFSDPACAHSTLYMEKKAVAGQPTVFQETFEYTSSGQYFGLADAMILPYDTTTDLYKEYTAEREKHIIFTPRLRQLADSLTAGLTTPLQKARALFLWVDRTFPWASAREYSTLDNIPMYVVQSRHGDCGQVSLLFITLCRICGIPAHFQSGFMTHPGAWNLHDWSEIYFEGVGWVPVDQSFGVPPYARSEAERLFFLGGIDSWRLIVNSDYGKDLSPQKQYPRSETVDFQRGEVEWQGGNLYFDQWSYDMDITYME